VSIMDLSGRIIDVSEIQDFSNTVDVKYLPAGIYYIRFDTEEGSGVKRFALIR
jgi:hypothetical protein